MRVTKTMKQYVEAQVEKAYHEKYKEIEAEYQAQRREVIRKIEHQLDIVKSQVQEILEMHDMDTTYKYSGEFQPTVDFAINLSDSYIRNDKKRKEISARQAELRRYKDKMLQDFYLECDLGINKDEFKSAVAALNFDNFEG